MARMMNTIKLLAFNASTRRMLGRDSVECKARRTLMTDDLLGCTCRGDSVQLRTTKSSEWLDGCQIRFQPRERAKPSFLSMSSN